MNYDLIVLGSGPAGLAAAVAACGRNKRVLVVGNRWEDSPLAKAERVDNYLGMPGLTGREMLEQFHRHAVDMGAEMVTGKVIALMEWDGYMLTVGDQVYQGRALVLAPGVVRQAKFPGEQEYLGRGVSYCATCDGMLYRGKDVVVVGRSKDAPHEANYLSGIGCKVTYIAPKTPEGLNEEIAVVNASRIRVEGEGVVTNVIADEVKIPCAGAFILREAVASTDLLPQLETKDGAVVVDRSMATNLPGVFAAGDCTGQPLQVAKAVGEGHIAGLSAADYLDRKDRE